MQVLFVIGGIGSGKSTVSRMLGDRGVPVLDLDKVGHSALCDRVVKDLLTDAFGMDVLGHDGEIIRSVLAKKAFVTPRATELLNEITQPWIYDFMRKWLKAEDEKGSPYAAVEVSAFKRPSELREVGYMNLIIAVVAPLEVRQRRAEANGFDSADISERIARQHSDSERRQWADYVIENDGSLYELRGKIDGLMEKISG